MPMESGGIYYWMIPNKQPYLGPQKNIEDLLSMEVITKAIEDMATRQNYGLEIEGDSAKVYNSQILV